MRTFVRVYTFKMLKPIFIVIALLTSGLVRAQILHTIVTPNTIDRDTLLLIDLDQDTVPDFAIRSQFGVIDGNDTFDIISVLPLGQQGHRVAGIIPTVFAFASRFSLNEFIGPETPFLNPEVEGGMSFAQNGQFIFNDPWNGGAIDEFLGFAIKKNENTHYGWAKVDIAPDGKSFTLKEYAVNLTPEEPINTNRFFNVAEHFLSDVTIWQSQGLVHVNFNHVVSGVVVELLDIQGRVLSQTICSSDYISLPLTYKSGVYLLRIRKDSFQVTRKIIHTYLWH
ncbi:putative secreted protein (Por secretion system target) [Schleiferia thermophila]|jgi:hypothetical protein|uniref:Putative secreted protein (Por secretion system target) n=2 Tax=Schleiferia thermophila TaxID=884107 RepID=A0A368ZYZ8_9FLAO|nr:putative secreted protein (Por secretion system target) [Schleiferia thermophila]GCD80872.1 hypothetical protein JCM30197_21190 [Schleiferia thermophila]